MTGVVRRARLFAQGVSWRFWLAGRIGGMVVRLL
jgi:hypothetical protein